MTSKYVVRANGMVVDEAATVAEASTRLRAAVRRWRQGQLFPRQARSPRSAFTAVRWDRTERRNTGAWSSQWELKERSRFVGYARVEKAQEVASAQA